LSGSKPSDLQFSDFRLQKSFMSLRLIQVLARSDKRESIIEILGEYEVQGIHFQALEEEKVLVRGIIPPENMEKLIENLDPEKKEGIERLFFTAVEATIPAIEEEEEEKEEEPPQIKIGKFIRISKDELRADVEESAKLNLNFVLLIILSSVVAGIGILKENTAIVIGAMVIAPFLGPNVALAFGTTVGDLRLIRRSLRLVLLSTGVAIGISVIWGMADPAVNEIRHDIFAEYRDIVLALTCGFAGVLSMMTGQATSLVGVMVAAALLPPIFRAGLFLGGQLYMPALNSFLIYMVNIICLNIAGILIFYLSGIRPKFWWEEKNAERQRQRALLIWAVILLLLIGTIWLLRRFGDVG
jgi:uncharacterized hydrophobic protein (TIGR00341 family)